MFEIKKLPEPENRYSIDFEGTFLAEAFYNEENVLFVEDYPIFDMNKIAAMKLSEFPDHFSLNMEAVKSIAGIFHLLSICKTGNNVKIKVETFLHYDSGWLAWNSHTFINAACKVIEKKIPFKAKVEGNFDEPPEICFEFTFPAEGTVGSMMKKCEKQCREVIRETELYLLNRVEKRLKK